MNIQSENWAETSAVFNVIEEQMQKTLTTQKDEIERATAERIAREKLEAQRKIEATEQEFAKIKILLEEHRGAMDELSRAKKTVESVIADIRARSVDARMTILKVSTQAAEELDRVGELQTELDALRRRAGERVDVLKAHLEENFGIKTELGGISEFFEEDFDWRAEIAAMLKVQELLKREPGDGAPASAPEENELSAEPQAAPPASMPEQESGNGDAPEAAAGEVEAQPEADEGTAAEGEAEESGADTVEAGGGNGNGAQAPMDETGQADEAPVETQEHGGGNGKDAGQGNGLEGLYADLIRFRKSEPVINGTEIVYFEKQGNMVLDGESFIDTMVKIAEKAKELHRQIERTESLKDVFLIKQEILNQQEVLRKVFFLAVKLCDKEGGSMPGFVSEILNPFLVKDLLERLTMGNWSNDADFTTFMEEISALRKAFREKTGAAADYVRSLLTQLDAE